MKMGHSDVFAVWGNFGADNIARCPSLNQLQMKGSSIADVVCGHVVFGALPTNECRIF